MAIFKFTAFCRQENNQGTTWIDNVDVAASNPDVAVEIASAAAVQRCSEAWGMDAGDIRCIGLAAGDVRIVMWDDIE